ncbi:hypothetical protein BMWSH_3489 [Priestia megaterium WSH-002]|uniref:Uncharacterized protein n=1 Tax=Priestia megaterium (strain WSH-002) TaxID=1006007 RepID=A0A8D4BL97_PRIMW|nr:hypothetical protein BMWSH_3489 [Priestia megaterium WSH-002]
MGNYEQFHLIVKWKEQALMIESLLFLFLNIILSDKKQPVSSTPKTYIYDT